MTSNQTNNNTLFNGKQKPHEVRQSNILAAIAVSDAVRSSLGPTGMDKMIVPAKGPALASNDGATILKNMSVLHPCARMQVELSASQDAVAGDGTTTVVIMSGSMLDASQKLLKNGIHPTAIARGFKQASVDAQKILEDMAIKIDLDDRASLIKTVSTSLNSKILSQSSKLASEIAIDSVLSITKANDGLPDLKNIKMIKKLGGTIDDMSLAEGLILEQSASTDFGCPSYIENAKVGLIQFQLSSPKTDMDNNIIIDTSEKMDRILIEDKEYIFNICKTIKETGCNVLLVQKSILRDGVSPLALHFLAKLGIMVIKDIDRNDIEFITKALKCKPVADIRCFKAEKLVDIETVEEIEESGKKIVKFSGKNSGIAAKSIIIRGSNESILEEVERSLHDAMCVVRCLVKRPLLLPGGAAAEMEVAYRLSQKAKELPGTLGYIYEEYAASLETIPVTLAENAGLNSVDIITSLYSAHAANQKFTGVDIRKKSVSNMESENVLQPYLVTASAINLATETTIMVLKIDDIIQAF